MFKKDLFIIGISGKMRRGKDTIAAYLQDEHGFKQASFGTKLKEICMNYDNSTDRLREKWNEQIVKDLYPQLINTNMEMAVDSLMQRIQSGVWQQLKFDECYDNKTDFSRHVMQQIGEGARQLRGQSACWVNYLLNKCINNGGKFAICDLRYRNEAYAIETTKGAQVWRVERELEVEPFGGDHISETDLDNYPFEVRIDNNGTIEFLYEQIDSYVTPLLRGQHNFSGKQGDSY